MSQSQGIEVQRPSRRTIAAGAAWAVPVIAIGAAAPASSASGECVPEFEVQTDGSFKCCNTNTKNMKLRIKIIDNANCLSATDNVCIEDVTVATPNQSIGEVQFSGDNCAFQDGIVTVYLLDVSNCTVNLLVNFTINGGPVQVAALKSGNIPSGNTAGDCQP